MSPGCLRTFDAVGAPVVDLLAMCDPSLVESVKTTHDMMAEYYGAAAQRPRSIGSSRALLQVFVCRPDVKSVVLGHGHVSQCVGAWRWVITVPHYD